MSSSSSSSLLKKYKKLKYLGKGSYGAALLVELRSNAVKYVMKEIVIGHLSSEAQKSAVIIILSFLFMIHSPLPFSFLFFFSFLMELYISLFVLSYDAFCSSPTFF